MKKAEIEAMQKEIDDLKGMVKDQQGLINRLLDESAQRKPALKAVMEDMEQKAKNVYYLTDLKAQHKCLNRQSYLKELAWTLESKGRYIYAPGIGRAESRFVKIIDPDYKDAVKIFMGVKRGAIIKSTKDGWIDQRILKIIIELFPDRLLLPNGGTAKGILAGNPDLMPSQVKKKY